MARVALLIGVSEDGLDSSIQTLSRAQLNLEAMQQVLQHPDIGRFAEVELLLNPDQKRMEQTIEAVFANREKYDLVLLYFSGQVFNDDREHLYFATATTQKNQQGELIKSTALAASYLQQIIDRGQSEQQVMILDCCLSGIATSQLARNNPVEFAQFSKAVVLLSVTPTPYSDQHKGSGLSEYTRYLVEGMETGVADLDNDGVVSVDELHNYSSAKVQTVAPAIKPQIHWGAKGNSNKLVLAKAPLGDPKFTYRKQVERLIKQGEISTINRRTLDTLREKLGISLKETGAIEAGVFQPHWNYQKKLQQYAQALAPGMPEHPKHTHDRLLQLLGLTNADVASIATHVRREPYKSLPLVTRTKIQNTLTLPREALPVSQRVVVAKPTTSNFSGTVWAKSANLTSVLVPENFRLLIGIGIATVLALAGIVSGSLLKPTSPSRLPPKPRPAIGPERPLQVEQAPERSLVPKPRLSPSPKPRSKLVPPPATSPPLLVPEPQPPTLTNPRPQVTPTKPRSRLETPPPVEQPQPKVSVFKPRPASAPKPRRAPTPEPPRTRPQAQPEPPSTPAPLPPATSTPEAPPTSWSEPPPTSAPGPI